MKEFDLVQEIEKYIPFDSVEEENKQKILSFLKDESQNHFERTNRPAHITAGALLVDEDFNILLNHHKIFDEWYQFGGHSDGNANSIEVAQKELEEESGIFGASLLIQEVFDLDINWIFPNAKKGESEHFHYDINFLFVTKDKNFVCSSESKELKWVTIEECAEYIKKDPALNRMIAKLKAIKNA